MADSLTLKQLVQIVPIKEEARQAVLSRENELTAEQKFKISRLCWSLLSVMFEERMKQKTDVMLKEMAEGARNYEKADFLRLEDEVLADILISLDEVKSKKELGAVKAELQANIEAKEQAQIDSPAPTSPPLADPIPTIE